MDVIAKSIQYIRTLFLKSRNSLEEGCRSDVLRKLVGITRAEELNIHTYLKGKGLIDEFNTTVVLTTDGIDYVAELRRDKIYQIISFAHAIQVGTTRDGVSWRYIYTVTDSGSKNVCNSIDVFISGTLSVNWGYFTWKMTSADYVKLERLLLQFAREKIEEKLKEGTLNGKEEVMLLTTNQPRDCPYNPENLPDWNYAEYEVEIDSKTIGEQIKENKLAASIIETRDVINAVFHSGKGTKLLLLNNERNLLDFFKNAKTEEEFSHRISSLAEVARNLNAEALRNAIGETDKKIGSVALLKKFLELNGKGDMTITDTLKQIGKVRQGYPAHTDNITEVIGGLRYFGLSYPIANYEEAWTKILSSYLAALKALYEILSNLYLPTKE